MLIVGEWKRLEDITPEDVPTDSGIYEFWIESEEFPTGKHYYGKTKNLQDRFKTGYFNRFKDNKNPKSHNVEFNNSIKKHTTKNLYFRIREIVCSFEIYSKDINYYKNILNDLEIRYIQEGLNKCEILFNKTSGGDGGDWYSLLSKEEQLEHNIKRSSLTSTTGIFHVYKVPKPEAKKGYVWGYRYNGTNIFATSLKELEIKVKSQGHKWIREDEYKTRKSYEEDEELEKTLYKGVITNTTGIKYVSKDKNNTYKKGFCWRYYNEKINSDRIRSASLKELEKEVKNRGYDWEVVNEYKTRKSYEEDEELEKTLYKGRKNNTTGIENVSKHKNKHYAKGFCWDYKNSKIGFKTSHRSLRGLEKKVKSQGHKWKILDKTKAKKSYEEDEKLEKTLTKNKNRSSTGIKYVYKNKDKKYVKGFNWRYDNWNVGFKTSNKSLKKLEQKVKSQGYIWKIVDDDKAKKSYEEDELN